MEQVFKLYLKKETCPVAEELGMLGEEFGVEKIVALVAKLIKDEPREVKFAFYLNSCCQLLGYQEVAIGGFNGVRWDAKVVFSSALLCGASKIVLVHNHPLSTYARLSPKDVRCLKDLIPGANSIGLIIADSIVVCGEKYMSAKEFGLFPNVSETLKEFEKESEKS